ncbi:MAG: winged helix-turn-helix transcriptional regulator [Acidobacteria bacterium]|nr:winged helix-turn-helix transcriptional regulator [Acidobacteriota bacterium]
MPQRFLVTKEFGALLGVLSHPCRLQIVEELQDREYDVNTLQTLLNISHSGVSQHLTLLRAHRVVIERREGRHVYYRLRRPELATWLLDGLRFLEDEREVVEQIGSAVESVRRLWTITKNEEQSRTQNEE